MSILFSAEQQGKRSKTYAVAAVFRSVSPFAGEPPEQALEWIVDGLDFIVKTTRHQQDAIKQVLDAHPHHTKGWSDDAHSQRVLFVVPLDKWREWHPKAQAPRTFAIKLASGETVTVKAVTYY